MTNPESLRAVGDQEHGEVRQYPLNLLLVPGARVQIVKGRFMPTEYTQSDGYGMLGGWVRVAAAAALYEHGITNRLRFTGTDTVPVNDLRYTGKVPSEAVVHRDAFDLSVEATKRNPVFTEIFDALEPPITEIDDIPWTSFKTLENLAESLQQEEGVLSVGVLTNHYNVPRLAIQADLLAQEGKTPGNIALIIMSAEDILLRSFPGVYNDVIRHAYASPLGEKRIAYEMRGYNAIAQGKYYFRDSSPWVPKT